MSSGVYSLSQIAALQQVANATMTTPCTISRGGSLLSPQPTMPDRSALKCSVAMTTTRIHLEGTPPGSYVPEWAVTLPVNTGNGTPLVIQEGDVITLAAGVDAGNYTAYDTVSAGTYSASLVVSTYKAPLNADGHSISLTPNVVCSVTHVDGTAGPQDVAGYLQPAKMTFTTQGGMEQTYMEFDFALIGQIKSQDRIMISAYGGVAVTIGPLEVSNVIPVGIGALTKLRAYLTDFSL